LVCPCPLWELIAPPDTLAELREERREVGKGKGMEGEG